MKAILGIIGGSGIYDLPGIEDVRAQRVDTPWGDPSDVLRSGRVVAAGPIGQVLTDALLSQAFDMPITVLRDGGRWFARRSG